MKTTFHAIGNNHAYKRRLLIISYIVLVIVSFTIDLRGCMPTAVQVQMPKPEVKLVVHRLDNKDDNVADKQIKKDTRSGLNDRQLNVKPEHKSVKREHRVGNGKKAGEQILLILLAVVFALGIATSIFFILYLLETGDPNLGGAIALAIGFGLLGLGLLVVVFKNLSRIWKRNKLSREARKKNPH